MRFNEVFEEADAIKLKDLAIEVEIALVSAKMGNRTANRSGD